MPASDIPCYLQMVSPKPHAHTMWSAPASREVPALRQLDMTAPPSGASEAQARAVESEREVAAAQTFYAARPTAASLRKRVR